MWSGVTQTQEVPFSAALAITLEHLVGIWRSLADPAAVERAFQWAAGAFLDSICLSTAHSASKLLCWKALSDKLLMGNGALDRQLPCITKLVLTNFSSRDLLLSPAPALISFAIKARAFLVTRR